MPNKIQFPVTDGLVRQLAWDSSSPCTAAPEILEILGLMGQSEDVEDLEHRASHARLEKLKSLVVPMAILASSMATLNANVAMYLAEKTDLELGDEDGMLLAEGYVTLIATSTVAILSQLISAGMITVTGKEWA